MSATAESILAMLGTVDAVRHQRLSSPGLADKVVAVKAFQQRRFSQTYADLLRTARYGAAARFFLEELYGPGDFSRRDSQFARVVPAMVRLFPREVVETVSALAELHALSETLDTAMGQRLHDVAVTPREYVRAWQATDRSADRQSQIALTLSVATRLDQFTHKPLLRNSLRLMRGPARAAGLAELQCFLERGFDTFRAMKGAAEFMSVVRAREQALVGALFDADLSKPPEDATIEAALSHLPATVQSPRNEQVPGGSNR